MLDENEVKSKKLEARNDELEKWYTYYREIALMENEELRAQILRYNDLNGVYLA